MADTAARCASDAIAHQNMRRNQNDNETTARHASDAIAHQNMHRNQSDNEAIAQHAANAEQHHMQCQAEAVGVQDQRWQLDAQCH